ncbi:hypothetical protein ACFQAT_10350 [Undibacterium arcticum]|uniref:HTH marR-type domain-containing protein n=1 Tax=Undibacterium arcticum TaxID=1762892 RepID=A0ABV7EXD6_9BURK
MRIHATAETSIACFHGRVQTISSDQQSLIVCCMAPNKDYSMQELAILTGLQTSTLSARLFELRKLGTVEHAAKRPCSISGVTIWPHKLASEQLELL